MFLKIFEASEGVLKREYRKQLFTSLSVIIITLAHGIGLGWLSPMLLKLQTPEMTPLNFVVTVEQASWIGAFISAGGFFGNCIMGLTVDIIGRKGGIYLMAVPHMCVWLFYYFASSVEFLYIARFCGGLTGGATYVVLPIFIGEIADSSIRGRLTSLFSVSLNTGVLLGFIMASRIPYHIIPFIVIVLPVLFVILATLYPETPQHLLRCGREEEAKASLQFYRNVDTSIKEDAQRFDACFTEMKEAILLQKNQHGKITLSDFCNKRALKAMTTGIILVILNIYCGLFAIMNYTSTIFAMTKSELHPDTNTIIIGMIQIVGTYVATVVVDRYGRKILMIVSTAGMGLGLAAFGMYAFFAEETDTDLSAYSWWMPVLLMAATIFICSIGINSVTFILLAEIMPPKIRAHAVSICLASLSVFSFALLKIFPILLSTVGLSATMWFCATVCAFGLFYVSIFLEETKGKSMDT